MVARVTFPFGRCLPIFERHKVETLTACAQYLKCAVRHVEALFNKEKNIETRGGKVRLIEGREKQNYLSVTSPAEHQTKNRLLHCQYIGHQTDGDIDKEIIHT